MKEGGWEGVGSWKEGGERWKYGRECDSKLNRLGWDAGVFEAGGHATLPSDVTLRSSV